MTDPAEQALLARYQGGDQQALASLLQTYERRLYNVCLRMVSNRDDAAELTQDAMAKVVEHLHDYRGDAELSTWMIRIAMNQSISHLRKRRLRHTVSLDAPASGPSAGSPRRPRLAALPSNGRFGRAGQVTVLRRQLVDRREPGPLERVQHREMVELLWAAIGRLEDEFRAVLVLRDIEELDYRQIADVLELKVGTVKSRLFRARLALRQQMVAEEQRPIRGCGDSPAPQPEVDDG